MTGRPAGNLLVNTILAATPFHFGVAELDNLVRAHGVRGELRHGVICPCTRPETHSPRGSCPSCKGIGWLYPQRLRCQTYMTMQDRETAIKHTDAGVLTDGDVLATALSSTVPERGDMWLPCGERHTIHQILWRRQQQVSQTDLRARLREQDRTANPVPLKPRLERLLYADSTNHICHYEIDEPTTNDKRVVEAVAGRDFVVIGQDVRWVEGVGPEPGRAYTMRYDAPAAYIVSRKVSRYREEAGQPLPQRCVLAQLDKMQDRDIRE